MAGWNVSGSLGGEPSGDGSPLAVGAHLLREHIRVAPDTMPAAFTSRERAEYLAAYLAGSGAQVPHHLGHAALR